METLKEIAEAWSQRARSPIIGSILLAALLINWKPFWYLLFAERPVRQKFLYFDANTSASSLIWWPIAFGLLAALCLPWIRLLGVVVVRAPTKLVRRLQHDDSHDQRIYQLKKSVEEIKVQAELDEAAEEAKIEAAKRLEQARAVGGETLEEELRERRIIEKPLDNDDLQNTSVGLLLLAASYDQGSIERSLYHTDDGLNLVVSIGPETHRISSNRQESALDAALEELSAHRLFDKGKERISEAGYRYLNLLDIDENTQSFLMSGAREYFFVNSEQA